MESSATTCDVCDSSIDYGVQAWLVHTGEVLDGLPVCKVECNACHFGDGLAASGTATVTARLVAY